MVVAATLRSLPSQTRASLRVAHCRSQVCPIKAGTRPVPTARVHSGSYHPPPLPPSASR